MTDMGDYTPGFCPKCGSIFPEMRQSGNVICYTCKNDFRPESKLKYDTHKGKRGLRIIQVLFYFFKRIILMLLLL